MKTGAEEDISNRRRRPRDIGLPENPSNDDLGRDWTLSSLDYIEVSRCRGDSHRLRFAVQLCVLRKYSRFLASYNRVPVRILNHLCKQLDLPPILKLEEPGRDTDSRHFFGENLR